MVKETIIAKIRELFDSDKSRTQTAIKLGVARATIFNWLNGRTNSLDIDALCKIANEYGVSVEWLLGASNTKQKTAQRKKVEDKLNRCTDEDLKKIELLLDAFTKEGD